MTKIKNISIGIYFITYLYYKRKYQILIEIKILSFFLIPNRKVCLIFLELYIL